MAKLTDLTNIITTLTDNDLVHFVDVDDPTQDPAGSSGKVAFSDLRTSLDIPDSITNEIIVKQESDFGVAVGNDITLQNNVTYVLNGPTYAPTGKSTVFLSKNLILPDRATIFIRGSGYANTDLIFTGSGVLFTSQTGALTGVGTLNLSQFNCIDGVGTNQIWDLHSSPTFSVSGELFCTLMVFTGWALKGSVSNMSVCNLNDLEFLQCGKLICTNLFAFTANAILSRNFVSTGDSHFEFIGNLNQSDISANAFIAAKGESILNVDPAILNTSGVSIGSAVPYQGNVIAGAVAYIDLGGGNLRVVFAGGHSFDNADFIIIQNSINYNGVFQVSNVVQFDAGSQTGTVDIVSPFVADDGFGLAVLLNAGLTGPEVEPFFKEGVTGAITSIADNGGGLARVSSAAHGRTTGGSLFISGTEAYDNGYYAVVIDVNNFDLLDSLGVPVPFTTPETGGLWDTSSLNQTNNVITASNTGGIIPDSQTLGNNILATTVAFASTTTLTRVSTGTWLADEVERFKATSDGRLIYTGRTLVSVNISAVLSCKKSGSGNSTVFVNIMTKQPGAPSFSEISNHPSVSQRINTADESSVAVPFKNHFITPGTEIGFGVASDTSITIDLFSIDLNIKK